MIFEPGDRVITPAGNLATVLPPAWEMPVHTLIQVDNGAKVWILTELLTKTEAPPIPVQPENFTKPRKRCTAKKSKL
ncbi:MAG: hypothetical protein SNJ57_18155 [Cyanobacteriota bacterium]